MCNAAGINDDNLPQMMDKVSMPNFLYEPGQII